MARKVAPEKLAAQSRRAWAQRIIRDYPADSEFYTGIRRIWSKSLITSNLVRVQPMALPDGLIFYLDYVYGTRSQRKNRDRRRQELLDAMVHRCDGPSIPVCQNHHTMTRLIRYRDELKIKLEKIRDNKFAALAQLVEHDHGKIVDVGSTPTSSSGA